MDTIVKIPPPVPPRRKKRLINLKIKSSHPTTTASSNNSVNRPYRKFRLPPPPPPPPLPPTDDMDESHVNSLNELKFNNNTSLNYNQARRKSFTILPSENIQSSSFSPKNSPQISTEISEKNYDDNIQSENIQINNDKEPEINNKIIQRNKSSMLFTLQDFQDVMSESKFSNLSKITKQSSVTSSSFDDDDDYTFFKLTTSSSAPFENYIDGWSVRLEDSSYSNQENKFIFDDYIDRGRQLTAERANLLLKNIDDGKGLEDSCPRVPKVRFVIQAPSDSLSDEGCEVYSVVDDNDLSLEDDSHDSWMPQSLSPLKITEINDSIEENESTEDNKDELLASLSEEKISETSRSVSPDPNVILESEFPIINMEKLNNTIESHESREKITSIENFDDKSFKDNPSNIKRDFFIKNMLNNDNSDDKNFACSVIATHEKSKESFDFLNNEKITDINLSSVLDNSESPSSLEEKKNNKISSNISIFGSVPKIPPKVPPKPLKNHSTTDDAKCQVLNELVCTFNSIKLKSLDNDAHNENFENNKKILQDDNEEKKKDEIMNFNCACSVDKKTEVIKNSCEISGASNATDDNNKLSSINKNKCAIVSFNNNNYSTKCINNDNNNINNNNNNNKIMTDVDISYDQLNCDKLSLDILPPGRVKNFIKNYEINVTKTTENSKINNTCHQDVVNNEKLKSLDYESLINNNKINKNEVKEDDSVMILMENQFDGDVSEKSGKIVALRLENPIQNAADDESLVPDSLLDAAGSGTGDQSPGQDLRLVSVESKAQEIHEATTDDNEIEQEIFFDTLTTTLQDANRKYDTREIDEENVHMENNSQIETIGMEEMKKSGTSTALVKQPQAYFLKTPCVFYLKM